MDGSVRLNLGCGSSYRPGFVNIDLYDRSVADVFSDVESLPQRAGIVDEIAADQLMEHFDLVHCRYVLASFFRILKPGGTLSLETPDLTKALKKLTKKRDGEETSTLQWLYGIDSPGLQHKTGFTYAILKNLLEDTGFEGVVEKKAVTHTYEPGLRVECKKPLDCPDLQFMAELRVGLKTILNLSDSLVMIPLEGRIPQMRSALLPVRSLDRLRLQKAISLTAWYNPKIPKCILGCLIEGGFFKEKDLEIELAVLSDLIDLRFHERAFALWIRSRKEALCSNDFNEFTSNLAKTVEDVLKSPERRDEILEYVSSLEPRPVEILDILLVDRVSRTSLNNGIRRFSEGRLDEAFSAFADSAAIDPGSPLAHWNLARLGLEMGAGREAVAEEYLRAESSMHDKRLRAVIRNESKAIGHDRKAVRMGPVSEYDMVFDKA